MIPVNRKCTIASANVVVTFHKTPAWFYRFYNKFSSFYYFKLIFFVTYYLIIVTAS